MIKKLPVLSILLLELITYAQKSYSTNSEIIGTVLDSNSKEPLPSASIVLFEKKTNTLFKVEISDLEGKFHFINIPSSIYTLKIQYIGYREKIIDSLTISKTLDLGIISISPIEQKLSEVNIVGTKSIIEQNATSTIVNVSESALATGGSIYEMLQKTPGVVVKEDNIMLRGKSLSLLLDGRLVNLPPEEVINLLKSLPNSSIEKMELIGNPAGKYDGQVQAILNIKTFKPKNDLWGGSITLAAGAGRKFKDNSSISLFYKKNNISISAGWDYLNRPEYFFTNINYSVQSNNNTSFLEEKRKQNIPSYTNTLRLDIEYTLHRNHTIGFSTRPTLKLEKLFTNAYTPIRQENETKVDSIYDFRANSNNILKNIAGNIYYKTTFDSIKNKELLLNIDYYGYLKISEINYTQKTLKSDLTEKADPLVQLNSNPLQIDIRSATADYSHNTSFGILQTGFKISWASIENSSIWKKYEQNNWITNTTASDQFIYNEYIQAIYGGIIKNFKKVSINASLRAEHTSSKGNSISLHEIYTKNYINLFPSIITEYHPSTTHEWIFSYRRGIRRPLYQQINPFLRLVSPNSYTQGSPSVFPELSNIEEITYGYKQHFFVKLTLRQLIPSFWYIAEQSPEAQGGIVNRIINYTSFYEELLSIYTNQSIASWWTINPSVGIYIEKGNHPTISSKLVAPKLSFSFSSSISLPRNWNIESSGSAETSWNNGYYYYGPTYYFSLGIKKTFLEKKISASVLLNGMLPYWYEESYLNVHYQRFFSFDQRFFMVSINYKIGNGKKNTTTKKSGLEMEKSRVVE